MTVIASSCAMPRAWTANTPLLDPAWTVREAVRRYPTLLPVFARHGMDPSTDEGQSLADMAALRRVPLGALMSDINAELFP